MIETLKYPTGEFTHTELAQLNGKTNQQVWTRYQQAIKDGVIVSAGTRTTAGKGKPSKLWKLNPNYVAPTVATTPAAPVTTPAPVVVPTEPVVVPAVAPTPEVTVSVATVSVATVPEPTPAPLPEATPATAPVVEAPVIVEVLKIEPPVETTPTVPEVKSDSTVQKSDQSQWRTLKEVCPICKHPLSAIDDATGVMVWCGQPPEVCVSAENPYGHGNNDRTAYEKLCEKFDRQPTRATS